MHVSPAYETVARAARIETGRMTTDVGRLFQAAKEGRGRLISTEDAASGMTLWLLMVGMQWFDPEMQLGLLVLLGIVWPDDVWTEKTPKLWIYVFIYFQNSSGMQSVNNQYFKNLLYCQPETTKRVVSCSSRLLNLVDEQLSMLELIYTFNLHTIFVLMQYY